ncbi:MAG: glutathione S-transferase [Alphaproteobacteria bacterium]|nr:glutathione S-transferase [Alphaproteobacteria bacterium]
MTKPAQPIRLYRHPLSGHAHRVELLLTMLGLPFEAVHVDLATGAHKKPDFLAKNPFGQVPVIEDGDVSLFDSNAILTYLAARYDGSGKWLPREPVAAAKVQQWLSVAAGPLVNGPAAARLVTVFKAPLEHDRAMAIAGQLFGVMNRHLATTRFLAGAEPTIADLAIYSYTAHAPEGGVSLEAFPRIGQWLERIEALPGFVPMQRTELRNVA